MKAIKPANQLTIADRQHGKSFDTWPEAVLFSQKYPVHWIHRLWDGFKGDRKPIGYHVVFWL